MRLRLNRSIVLIFFICSFILALDFLLRPSLPYKSKENCPFCNEAILQRQKVYENEDLFILYNYKPMVDGHCLIVPKTHACFMHELSDEQRKRLLIPIAKLQEVSQEVFHTKDYILLQKNGPSVGQSVGHVHIHFIPRHAEKKSVLSFTLNFLFDSLRPKINDKKFQNFVRQAQKAFEQVEQHEAHNNH